MYTTAATLNETAPPRSWLGRIEQWLDERGKAAWIAAMVLGFILFWPVGLALLAYMIWSKRMFGNCANRHHREHGCGRPFRGPMSRRAWESSGNSAFDAYKSETLQRLEEEQKAFQDFLRRLRDAKDKAEFDQYMEERAKSAKPDTTETGEY